MSTRGYPTAKRASLGLSHVSVGKLAAFLISHDATWITGTIYRIDGGGVGG